jgi:long-chain acyl-CoA synthetase
MEDGEVTPTLKLKRRVVHDHFAEEIEALYAGDQAVIALEPRD